MSNRTTDAISLWLSNDESMYSDAIDAAHEAADVDDFEDRCQFLFAAFDFDGFTITNTDIDWDELYEQFKEVIE